MHTSDPRRCSHRARHVPGCTNDQKIIGAGHLLTVRVVASLTRSLAAKPTAAVPLR